MIQKFLDNIFFEVDEATIKAELLYQVETMLVNKNNVFIFFIL